MEADLFNIYNDNASTVSRLPLVLPGGGCNFADLNSPLGLKCGCRRFYSRHQPDQAGWCMCNHHACYHDQGPLPDDQLPAAGQENEPPSRSMREPLSPLAGTEWKESVNLAPGPLSFVHDQPVELDRRSVAEASLPDTLAWGEAPARPGATILPPIPSQCLLSSQASTASSAQARLLRPFGGKGLVTLKRVEESSLSRQPAVDVHRLTGSLSRSEPRTAGAVSLDALMDLTSAVSDHGHRLDRLETASFHGDCHDRLENAEVRVYELESRIEEVEKLAGDGDSTVISCALGPDDVDPSQEVQSQLQSLQAQVAQLQALLPSPQQPWKIEVVFLPFPLRKVWQEPHQFKEPGTPGGGGGDDWTQSNVTRRSQSPFVGDWNCSDRGTRWLHPKACNSSSVVAKRLRSRGLIRNITISRPDHQGIQAAVSAAFDDVFRQMGIAPRPHPPGLMGLHQSWVPLRKVHLDSRLRFLSQAEMVTPGLWDAQFLGSVLMRSSRRTLFITHPDAYLQDRQAYSTAWTWQRLRELSRVYPDESESSEVPEADAMEEYWSWAEHLDEAVSKPLPRKAKSRLVRSCSAQPPQRLSSPSVAVSLQALRRRDSAATTTGMTTGMTTAPILMRVESSPHVSMAVPRQPSPAPTSRRRVVSTNGRPSPSARVRKKRRRTRSRSHQRYFTPRWTASPSPMPTVGFYDRQRGMTPFAYATPYSMAPPLPEVLFLCGETPTRSRRMSMMDLDGESESGESYVGEEEDEEGEGEDEDDGKGEKDEDEGDDDDDDEDDDDDDDDDDDGGGDGDGGPRAGAFPLLPEDEPWPGIEEADGENSDDDEGSNSDASSQPSEYPSRGEVDRAAFAFRIPEDS
ncbi:hypothetical protein CP532_5764 [Ophiocordyceps camponoti-leonardi (nom. inval.)]|nr:hypothetical protein CP532_5764 [Ophiocordyceps camponoti-leonardi (nom. inval.)]